jgi:hypothetical protein
VVTVEGIGSVKKGLHPVQKELSDRFCLLRFCVSSAQRSYPRVIARRARAPCRPRVAACAGRKEQGQAPTITA